MRYLLAILLTIPAIVLAKPPIQLVSRQQESVLRRAFPKVADKSVQALLQADDLIFYTEQVMPKAFQHDNTFHTPYHNFSGEFDPLGFGNGNREFPWGVAGGTHGVKNLLVFRFIQLPRRNAGGYWPVVYWNEKLPPSVRDGNIGSTYRWRYPVGTTFGEMLGMLAKDGHTYPFELRLRFREKDEWAVDVFRPFPTAKHLATRIAVIKPAWQQNKKLTLLMSHLQDDWTFPTTTLRDHSGKGFNRTVKFHTLPPIDDNKLVAKLLLTTQWESALGADWKKDVKGGTVSAPTAVAGAGLHIVPAGYSAHGFGTDRKECFNCHRHTNRAVSTFNNDRGWYGRIRGSDGIFSFHPISHRSIASNGMRVPVRINAAMLNSGVVARYNRDKHPKSRYSKLSADFYTEGK